MSKEQKRSGNRVAGSCFFGEQKKMEPRKKVAFSRLGEQKEVRGALRPPGSTETKGEPSMGGKMFPTLVRRVAKKKEIEASAAGPGELELGEESGRKSLLFWRNSFQERNPKNEKRGGKGAGHHHCSWGRKSEKASEKGTGNLNRSRSQGAKEAIGNS